MKFYRPKSFSALVLIGFAFVSIPLIVALVNAEIFMGQLAKKSERTIFSSVTGSQLSQALLELILLQERKARQYNVLGDNELKKELVSNHLEILQTIDRLAELRNDAIAPILLKMQKVESTLFQILQENSYNSKAYESGLHFFLELDELGAKIHTESNAAIINSVHALKKAAHRAQRILLWLSAALIPFTLIFIIRFSMIISRPIKQIDHGIHCLGEGDFTKSISVTGPQDLIFLGKRLDWLRRQLQEFETKKRKVTAHVSHELKTPLASICEGSELLSEEVVGALNEQQHEITEILKKNSSKLQELIDDLLAFNMAHARMTALKKSKFDMRELVTEALEDHKALVLKKDIQLSSSLKPVTISGDREHLRTVIDNLLSNAVKYTPNSESISIIMETDEDCLTLDVHDTGPGIPYDEQEKIFEPFYLGTSSGRSHIKGTGLGLAIAKEYITAHDGTLDLIPKNAGGAHFRVTLPLTVLITI